MDIPIYIQVKLHYPRYSNCGLTPSCSLDLLRSFYSEGLVDNRTFLSWLVLQMCTCNLAQASFVARLADEYLDGILACRALSRPFMDACLSKISEVQIMLTTVIDTTNKYLDAKFFRQGNPPLG
jgi:hypothetical protein